ncbi:hypothetical protein RJ641_035857 [Dillenia turbinata]|uniref:Uncharacterized protein n=1 Tax=Dillenia turbinata TaxID=194707 RepID=A0AAN8VDD1_9MAGN
MSLSDKLLLIRSSPMTCLRKLSFARINLLLTKPSIYDHQLSVLTETFCIRPSTLSVNPRETMDYHSFPDIWGWIQNLPSVPEWKTDTMSICICSWDSKHPILNLCASKSNHSVYLSFSITTCFNIPISLWTSKPIKINSKSLSLSDEETIFMLFLNFIEGVLSYGSSKSKPSVKVPRMAPNTSLKDIFNLSFFTLTFVICIYEAPADFRSECLNKLKNHLTCWQSREASKQLMRLIGTDIEEKWVRSLNLAITNWIEELQATNHTPRSSSPLFSYSLSTIGLWKVQLYCPIATMEIENSSNSPDERLLTSLKFHQLEGVIQFNHKVITQEKWLDVMINIDNIRCDVVRLLNENLMTKRGVGPWEKHFPSRISLQLTPSNQTNVISLSVSKSSENPSREIGLEKTVEGSFEPPNSFFGLGFSAGESITMILKPWKFEESAHANSANFHWFLHDSIDGREVFSSKPSLLELLKPKAWFKNRYSSAYRPFTRQGGVIFAGDEYGEGVCWRVEKCCTGKTMEWEIRGRIWLTYWPNKHKTLYTETRRLEFQEVLHLTLA